MRRLLPLIALVVLGTGGCGDEDDEPGRTVTVKSGTSVPVIADEYSFDPETIVVTGGGDVTFELENSGVLAHNLRVFHGDNEIGGTPTFTGGNTKSGSVSLERGEYEMVCTVGNHADLGMKGKLSVR